MKWKVQLSKKYKEIELQELAKDETEQPNEFNKML